MDVDRLRNELEQFLAKNPDADAPHGFRARFDQVAADLQAGSEGTHKSGLEAQLEQIRDEAEAAVEAAEADRIEVAAAPAAPAGPVVEPPATEPVNSPASGGFLAYGIGILVAIVAMGGAYYFFRH